MARRQGKSLGMKLASLIVILLMIAIIALAVLELFVAPKTENVESKYKNNDNIAVVTVNDGIINLAALEAGAALLLYGYTNDSITSNVSSTMTILYSEKDGDSTTTYSAIVIYFKNIKDANTARDGISAKAKENNKIAMFRGKALILGDKKAALKYYAVLA